MLSIGRAVKVWVIISLLSLFVFNAYWTNESYDNFFRFLQGEPQAYRYVTRIGLVFWAGHMGLTARFIGVTLGLLAVFLLWVKARPFLKVKRIVAAALFLEALNFVGFIPSVPYLSRAYPVLAAGYALQILFIVPFLSILAVKVLKYEGPSRSDGVWKWAGVAFVGYIAGLWANSVFRWFNMVGERGIAFLLTGTTATGFLVEFSLMSLAVVFAVEGAYSITRRKESSAFKWLGSALAMVGLNFVIYLVNSYNGGMLSYVLLVDVWAIPLLGLGVTMLNYSRTLNKRQNAPD